MEGHSGKPLYLIENPQLRPQLGICVGAEEIASLSENNKIIVI